MKKLILVAALIAACAAQPVWAAGKSHKSHSGCAGLSAAEAEQAIRYITDLMVASSACRNTTYAEFALRNRLQIIHYQKAMINHLHSTQAFDKWNTSLANAAAMRQSAVPITQFCQQSEPMLKQASALDARGFQAFAAAQAATAQPAAAKCSK